MKKYLVMIAFVTMFTVHESFAKHWWKKTKKSVSNPKSAGQSAGNSASSSAKSSANNASNSASNSASNAAANAAKSAKKTAIKLAEKEISYRLPLYMDICGFILTLINIDLKDETLNQKSQQAYTTFQGGVPTLKKKYNNAEDLQKDYQSALAMQDYVYTVTTMLENPPSSNSLSANKTYYTNLYNQIKYSNQFDKLSIFLNLMVNILDLLPNISPISVSNFAFLTDIYNLNTPSTYNPASLYTTSLQPGLVAAYQNLLTKIAANDNLKDQVKNAADFVTLAQSSLISLV